MHVVSETTFADLLSGGGVRSVFQPIVDLVTGRVVAFEALARGPEGRWHSPASLFDTAREQGLLGALDEACRDAALRGARELGILDPVPVFVNVEPEVLDADRLPALPDLTAVPDLGGLAGASDARLRVVLEITERALATRPAELLATVDRVRERGWGIALDDVGADSASLAFMPLLQPDVVKLDLRLVQRRASQEVAEVMHAVNAYAERTGALVLAEGIETEAHVHTALGLGATLGQGWHFGRPAATVQVPTGPSALTLPTRGGAGSGDLDSPFGCLAPGARLRRAPKRLLVELSKQLEREALRLGETSVVASTFQYAAHFTPDTARRYRDLVEHTGFVCALGEGLDHATMPGLRGATLATDDPVAGEWDVVVLAPHFSAALLARDLGSTGADMDRMFEYSLTYDRDVVVRAMRGLLSRVVPRPEASGAHLALPAPLALVGP